MYKCGEFLHTMTRAREVNSPHVSTSHLLRHMVISLNVLARVEPHLLEVDQPTGSTISKHYLSHVLCQSLTVIRDK